MQRSNIATRLRLASGLILMTFVAGHLVNHGLTLHSLDMVAAGQSVFLVIWRSLPGTFLLYGALITHVALTLLKLYQRRRLRMPLWEIAQIGLGLAIPFWLVLHILGTRGVHQLFGVTDSYLLQFGWVWAGNTSHHMVMLFLAAYPSLVCRVSALSPGYSSASPGPGTCRLSSRWARSAGDCCA